MTLGDLIKDLGLWIWNNPLAALLILLGYAVISNARKSGEQKAKFGIAGILYELYELLFTGINIGKIILWITLLGFVGRTIYVTIANTFNGVDTENLPRIGDSSSTPVAIFSPAATPKPGNTGSTAPAVSADIKLGWYELRESATCRTEPNGQATAVVEIPTQNDFKVESVHPGDGFCVGSECRRVYGQAETGEKCYIHASVLGVWIKP